MLCINLDSNYPRGYFRGAIAFYEKGEFSNALELLNKFDKIDNDKELIGLRDKIKHKLILQENLLSSIYLSNIEYESYPKILTFFKWLDDNKVYYPKLELKYLSEQNRAIFAKSKIRV